MRNRTAATARATAWPATRVGRLAAVLSIGWDDCGAGGGHPCPHAGQAPRWRFWEDGRDRLGPGNYVPRDADLSHAESQQPADAARCRAFIAKCRSADGGYAWRPAAIRRWAQLIMRRSSCTGSMRRVKRETASAYQANACHRSSCKSFASSIPTLSRTRPSSTPRALRTSAECWRASSWPDAQSATRRRPSFRPG